MSLAPAAPAPSVRSTFMRGGTSKALFFHEKDLPPAGRARDHFLIRVMGSPDPSQIDGMGGTRIVTSKVAIVRPSSRPDADVDFIFAQIGLGEATVAYDGNCGNISAAVGPFAINEGLVKLAPDARGMQMVKIFNTGREANLIAHVPVDLASGRAREKGDCQISGVPGAGAGILMDYCRTAQADALLPTKNATDHLDCSFGMVEATFCNVGNPIVFVAAESVGMQGNETPPELDGNSQVLSRIREVRGRMAQKLGFCSDWTKVDQESPMLPMVAALSHAKSARGHVQSRLFLDNHCHPAMAGTGGVCTTATSRITGSVTNRLLAPDALKSGTFVIEHPSGYLPLTVATDDSTTRTELPHFTVLGFERTVRSLFRGELFIPEDIQDEVLPTLQDVPEAPGPSEAPQVGHVDAARPVTITLAKFVQDTQLADVPRDAVERIRQCLVDHIGVALLGARAGDSSACFVQGIEAVTKDCGGSSKVIGLDKLLPKQYAAFLSSAFSHTLDFDDTHSGGIIHVAADVIATALTEAQGMTNLAYGELIVALAVGYEVATRVAVALGVSCWHRGFHNTSIAGIFGAVATLSKLRRLTAGQIENAFGLAGSFASGSMQYLENGAWNKRLHPAKAAHDAFIVVVMAQAGMIGASEPIEGRYGLIKAHTDTPDASVDVGDLGQRWELVNTALKPYPGCRATHPGIELAALFAKLKPAEIPKSIHVTMDPSIYPIVADPVSNKIHAKDVVDAQFSAYYQIAVAWTHGDELGWKVYDHINDESIQSLCDCIRIEPAPMANNLQITMTVEWKDGTTKTMTLDHPKWEQPQRPPKNEEVAAKFRSVSADILGEGNASQVIDFAMGSLEADVTRLLALL